MLELGASPEQTLMVGDTSFDMEMAAAAGASAVGVLGGSHSDDDLRQAGAVAVLEGVVALTTWLDVRA